MFVFFWGLAEATVFIFVPDILLSWYALESRRRALRACLFALGGALTGGVLMWVWGFSDLESARHFITMIPFTDVGMIDKVHSQFTEHGALSVFLGPATGTPYKIYAMEAAQLGFALFAFLLISIPARLARFVVVAVLIGTLGRSVRRYLSLRTQRIVLVVGWIIFYAWYFHAVSSK